MYDSTKNLRSGAIIVLGLVKNFEKLNVQLEIKVGFKIHGDFHSNNTTNIRSSIDENEKNNVISIVQSPDVVLNVNMFL